VRILVNAQQLIENKLEGWGWFTYETLKRITKNNQCVEFIFIFDRKYPKEFVFNDNVLPIIQYPQSKHPFLWEFKFQYLIPKLIKKYNPDLFLSTDGFIPTTEIKTKTLSVIHDLNFEHFPEIHSYFVRNYYKKYFPLFASKATRIATVSEFSKEDIVNHYAINPEKIDVVYNGINENFLVINEQEKISIRQKYTKGQPYMIYVGSLNPRKNIINILKAYDLYRSNYSQKIKLVLSGSRKSWNSDMELVFKSMIYKEDIIFTDHVTTEQLTKLIGSALCLTYPSIFEGFGIPIIEAMNAGIPVITSNTASMPEVANNAAILTDPYSIDSIVNAMMIISTDENKRNELIIKGFDNAKKYSWDKTANLLWESVQKTLSD